MAFAIGKNKVTKFDEMDWAQGKLPWENKEIVKSPFFCLMNSLFSTKVSFQATFRTEHFRKLKKLGLAWTPSRAYAIGKKENHQIS